MTTAKRGRGAPTKAPGGMERVLYVRASADLIDGLDALVKRERGARRGAVVSRGDVVRGLLYEGVKRRAEGAE